MTRPGNNIPLTRPFLSEAVKQRVLSVLDSGHWTEGSVTRQLEQEFRNYIGCKEIVAVTSCTTGLEMALKSLKIGPGAEVIIPDFTHPATACAVLNSGATAVIVDISPDTLLIDYGAMESAITTKTKVIMPVSLFGNPLDWQRLHAVQKQQSLFMVEDAACSVGAEYLQRKIGNQADLTVFSLHPRKMLAVGEGGLISTNQKNLADWLRSYKCFGSETQPNSHLPTFVREGSNHKMSDILAAIGVEQLAEIDALINVREELCNNYSRLLAGIPGVRLQHSTSGGRHSWQSFCIMVKKRDAILKAMRNRGIEVQIGTFALHREPAFRSHQRCRFQGPTDAAQQAFAMGLTLPLYYGMQPTEQEYVVEALQTAMRA